VNPDGSGDFPTIQEAVNAAVDGDDIVLGDGVFRGDGNRDVLVYKKSVSVRSDSGDPLRCVIECEGRPAHPRRGFFFVDTGPSPPGLEGISVRNGWFDIGGGLLAWLSPVNVVRCVFDGNVAEAGGAIFCSRCTPTVEDCVMVNNRSVAGPGAAVIATARSSVTLRNCTIVGNETLSTGSAIGINDSSTIDIQNSILAYNVGGELFYCDGTATIRMSCTDVFGNDSGDWTGCIAGQGPLDANFSLDPLFCRTEGGDYSLRADSPCAAPGVTGCGLVGALSVSSPCRAIVVPSTWGKIKTRYR
jgi:predicted outer membrane repeat protein